MHKLLVALGSASLGWFTLTGCAVAAPGSIDDPPVDEQPARFHPRLENAEPTVPIALPSRDGSLVLVDADGNELARTPTAQLGGEIDATFDAGTRTITTFEPSSEDEESGQLRRYELTPDLRAFASEGVKLAKASGTSRLASARLGVVQFEESMGTRWKGILHSAKQVKSVACPRPSSVTVVESAGASKVVALAERVEDDGWARLDVDLTADGWGPCTSLPLPQLALANPRLVVLPDGEEIAVGVEDGMLALRAIGSSDAEATSTGVVAEGLGTAIHASIPRGGAEDVSVLVALTARPTRVVVAWRWSEGGVSAIRSGFADVPGVPRVDDRSMARDVAVVGDRVLCATSAGVFAFDVSFADGVVNVAAGTFGPDGASFVGPITPLVPPS